MTESKEVRHERLGVKETQGAKVVTSDIGSLLG